MQFECKDTKKKSNLQTFWQKNTTHVAVSRIFNEIGIFYLPRME